VRSSRADAVRLLWLTAGERGDYRALFDGSSPTREQLLANVVDGFQRKSGTMGSLGSAGRSVELSRQLATEFPSAANRLLFARSLLFEGDASRAAARFSNGAAQEDAYRHSRDRYLASIEILKSLENSGQLPTGEKATLFTLINHLAENVERMVEASDSRKASGK
jgi:hypothetical protein